MNGDQGMMENNAFHNVPIKKAPFTRNNNSLSFPLIPFFDRELKNKIIPCYI